jgi:hypothetical protein
MNPTRGDQRQWIGSFARSTIAMSRGDTFGS